mmetsp:Transcript_10964/g.46822  ORF Transcript_10964/g.46822 Transcript_10964/m.46822 type:complete len:274 (+) Transcript_10964:1269-2090(+)
MTPRLLRRALTSPELRASTRASRSAPVRNRGQNFKERLSKTSTFVRFTDESLVGDSSSVERATRQASASASARCSSLRHCGIVVNAGLEEHGSPSPSLFFESTSVSFNLFHTFASRSRRSENVASRGTKRDAQSVSRGSFFKKDAWLGGGEETRTETDGPEARSLPFFVNLAKKLFELFFARSEEGKAMPSSGSSVLADPADRDPEAFKSQSPPRNGTSTRYSVLPEAPPTTRSSGQGTRPHATQISSGLLLRADTIGGFLRKLAGGKPNQAD